PQPSQVKPVWRFLSEIKSYMNELSNINNVKIDNDTTMNFTGIRKHPSSMF
ncbi:4798_t:CDS:1, partial [Scutellospora calospora]